MRGANDRRSEDAPSDPTPGLPANQAPIASRGPAARPDPRHATTASLQSSPSDAVTAATQTGQPSRRLRHGLLLAAVVVGLTLAAYYLSPWVVTALTTVSTDDAYVNSHVTFVAPRVMNQVSEVLVDDNYRVKKGELLVKLDPEPYQVQVAIKKAAVDAAETNLVAAEAQVHGQVAQARANRYKLERAVEDVDNQIANLSAAVATLNSRKATLVLAQANLRRGEKLFPQRAISQEDLDALVETEKVAEAGVEEAVQAIYSIRVGLGLPAQPPAGQGLAQVPAGLDQNFSAVRQALGDLLQSAAQFGYYPTSWTVSPQQAIANFYKQDPQGNLNRILARLIPQAPAIKQAQARLLEARRDLAQAELNLRYCDIFSEIDGVVTSRTVNPGDYVQVGQSLMAVRSLREIWIDANFKETQLDYLRIGQRVRCEVDMYGRHREFEGRITGFTMGTGETLSLLPPQNATGNFVKIVQRLPVRVELTNYDADKDPLFVGLSVTPYVYYKEPPTGAYAGRFLQSLNPIAQRSTPVQSIK
jgi:membrane fusion protein (multidrug efflux system)